MEPLLDPTHFDLITSDGRITALRQTGPSSAEATVLIEPISPTFIGFQIDLSRVIFNIKSTLAQLGLEGKSEEISLDRKHLRAEVKVKLQAIGHLATLLLPLLEKDAQIGKLFAADERRRVRDPTYLSRMFGRADRWGRPLLLLGGHAEKEDFILDKIDGRTVAFLPIQQGRIVYDPNIEGFLPTLAKALKTKRRMRELLKLNQGWNPHKPHNLQPDEILLVRTVPLHIRTVFGKVVDELLSEGYHHTSANVLQPDTMASGDVYELYGESKREISDIPLEFYTLEPYREYIFYKDRDVLHTSLTKSSTLFEAFESAPKPLENKATVFIVKGEQLLHLHDEQWISKPQSSLKMPFLENTPAEIQKYIHEQPEYPFLKAIDDDVITSEGVLLTRYFPTPLMKRMLLSNQVLKHVKGLYFRYPSFGFDVFFSAEDRALLFDLNQFSIPVFWIDGTSGEILKYTQKSDRDSGLFVPLRKVETFLKATVFGIYGSNLLEGQFEHEIHSLLQGLLQLRQKMNHPLLNPEKPLALATGGGPGLMEVGNRVAKEVGILSCANIIDFRASPLGAVNEQEQNPYIEAKMTYRLDKLVERQAEFNLDFPILLTGGIGTDFELALEEVRRKVGSTPANPILLFGSEKYWEEKITHRFRCNLDHGTIRGSEWVSNCLFCVQSAEEGLKIYNYFFQGMLPIGKEYPPNPRGFITMDKLKTLPL